MLNLAAEAESLNNDREELLPPDHMRLLHPAGRRGIVTLSNVREGDWIEKAFPIQDLPDVVRQYAGIPDVYASQQSFFGWRRISKLSQIGCAYTDLDFHQTEYADLSPEQMADLVLRRADDHGIPGPSMILATGRGLVCLWLHDLVPRRALPRWNAVQRHLWEALKPFGADRRALDAARVFRVAGTINSRNQGLVRPVWMEAPPQLLRRWDFEDLCREILPIERGELISLTAARAARKARGKVVTPPATRLTIGTLWESRLTDLQKIRHGRWFGDLPPGQRNAWMFLAGLAMSWLSPPEVLQRELYALAQECGGWSDREAKSRMQAVFKRARDAAAGKTYEYQGEQFDPRYRFRTETIIEWLGVTEDEMRAFGLRSIVSDRVRRELDTERKIEERRGQGVVPRQQYLAQSLSSQKPWEQLGMSRATWYRKGKPKPQETAVSSA